MLDQTLIKAEIARAAEGLVAAFGSHDAEGYFSCFSPDATFIFYSHPDRLNSRAEWRALWDSWELNHHFRVNFCNSTNQEIQLLGDSAAVFHHSVETSVTMDGQTEILSERETVIFRKESDKWLAVHEHLSAHHEGS